MIKMTAFGHEKFAICYQNLTFFTFSVLSKTVENENICLKWQILILKSLLNLSAILFDVGDAAEV